MPRQIDLMNEVFERAFADAAVDGLFGDSPERAAAAYGSFYAPGTHPSIIVECPLLGEPSYDVLVGAYGKELAQGTHLPADNPPACHAAYDWASAHTSNHDIDLFFELDAAGPEGQHAGIHCRNRDGLDFTDDFYRTIGEGWRAPLYRSIAERLAEGWRHDFAAVFAGRPGAPTRLEVACTRAAQKRIAEDPAHLRACFDQMGFSAYDDAMLEQISHLASISFLDTLQFDILADGTVGSTFSITSCFERTGANFARLFADDGIITRICRTYEDMGCADERWRLAEQALFATKRASLTGSGLHADTLLSIPNCGKAKWIGTKLQPAKFYLLMGAFS